MVIAREGRLEEEMFLTTFLWEEAKHTEFMRRFLDEVAGVAGADLHHYHTPSYRKIFYEELPRAMHRLLDDPSPAAQAEASVTYNLIVEGVLAETGYYAFYRTLQRQGVMPGFIQGIRNFQRDESRHLPTACSCCSGWWRRTTPSGTSSTVGSTTSCPTPWA